MLHPHMTDDIEKVQTPRGEGRSMTALSPYQVTISSNYDRSQGIIRNGPEDWFGPLNPMEPIAPPEVAGRQFDYPHGYNLVNQPRAYEQVGFQMLRSLAEVYDLLRLVIETRKDQLCKLNWSIRVKGTDKKSKIKDADQARIDALTPFFSRPDGITRYRAWLRSYLEDLCVIDAPAIYCQRNRGGQLIALKQIDGATVKVLVDDWGRTPVPYVAADGGRVVPPAYQQALKGYPAVNYSVEDLIYRPYNKRAHKVYGYSPVEQIITTVNIALRRQQFMLSYYTEGNVPESLIGAPDSWTPDQIQAFQTYWDAMLSGNLAVRRRAKFVPGGVAKTFIPTKEPELTGKTDEWLARVVCFAHSMSPQPFVQMMNRATAGTAQDTAKEEGIEPYKDYIREWFTDVIEVEFGSRDLEFAFDEEIEVDQEKQTNILAKRVEDGLITLNEAREELGEEPSEDPAADQLMVKTATGYLPIGANTLEEKKKALDLLGPPEPAFGGKPPAGNAKPNGGAANPDESKGKPVKKKSAAGRRLEPIPFDRPKILRARAKAAKLLRRAFGKAAKKTKAAVKRGLAKVAKADDSRTNEEIAAAIAADADLSDIEAAIDDVADALAAAAQDYAEQAVLSLGVDAESDLMDVVNERAADIARDYAAELVGKRYVDGELVDNPDARYQIEDTTRDAIREAIADGLDENIGNEAIADEIADIGAFSDDRAELIAFTEIRDANSAAAVEGYRIARDEAGVNVKKEWILGPNPCEICQENADAGAIDVDDDFPSGDSEPTAHPNCECAVAPVVEDEPADEAGDEE